MRDRTYRLEVAGELGDQLGSAFEGMRLTHAHGNTILTGLVSDQTALYGVLQRIADFGLTLISVNALEEGAGQ